MFLWNIAVTSLVEVWIEIFINALIDGADSVTSLVEVWIEILCPQTDCGLYLVTSLVEVWIEISSDWKYTLPEALSLPLWKCGLKFPLHVTVHSTTAVTSLVEVWIEIKYPHCINPINLSLPLWKCGLK